MNIPRSTLRRRRFIRSGSMMAAGLCGSALAGYRLCHRPSIHSSPTAPLATSPPGLTPPDPGPVPPEPVLEEINRPPRDESTTPDARRPLALEDRYAGFLASLGLRHLAPCEIIDPHRNVVNEVPNALPPESLWEDLVPTLRLADEIRERLGAPLCRITSAYRCPRYNAQIPGAVPRSYHTRNQALDVVYYCSPRKAYRMALKLRRQGFFRGGVGLYPTFIHIDTRGYAATWRG